MTFIISSSQNNTKRAFIIKGAKILLLFFFISPVIAQNCIWARNSSDDGYNEGSGVCTDPNGNVYITGDFTSPVIAFGSHTLAYQGYRNVFVAKYDANGNALWARSGEGFQGNDFAYGVHCDMSGNAYICGNFSSTNITFGGFSLTNSGGRDYYIVKYDPNGNVLWAKSAGNEGDESAYSVASDSQGNIYVSGYSTSSLLTIGSYSFSDANHTMFLVKYDGVNGNILWAKSGKGNAVAASVIVDKNDNILIGGEFNNSTFVIDTYTLTRNDNDEDFFVAKLDVNGNTLWARNGSNRYVYSLCSNSNGDIFALGSFYTPTLTVGTYTFLNSDTVYGTYDIFLVKYDKDGYVTWAKSFGTGGNENAYSVASDISNIYITGFVLNPIVFGTYTLQAQQGGDDPMFFVRFDFSGNVRYATYFKSGGGGGSNQNGVCTDNYGNVYIGSDFNDNPFIIDSQTLNLTGTRDVFLAKFHFDDVGIKENKKEGNNSIIYPNPNDGTFTIKLQGGKQEEKAEISIFDITGRLISRENRNITNGSEIGVKSDLKDGMYLLKVKFEDDSYDVHHLIISK